MKASRLRKFHKDKLGFLHKLRKHKSLSFHHTPVKNDLSAKGEVLRSTCPLCSDKKRTVKRQTRYKCATCEVPLCCTAIGDRDDEIHGAGEDVVEATAKSCFALWHECANLEETNKKLNKRLVESKQSSSSRNRARHMKNLLDFWEMTTHKGQETTVHTHFLIMIAKWTCHSCLTLSRAEMHNCWAHRVHHSMFKMGLERKTILNLVNSVLPWEKVHLNSMKHAKHRVRQKRKLPVLMQMCS